ncbi:GAF domain-containing protein [Cognatilysobacter bugurensis]|uniref:GAF domain-containing protein n=1 Tax=Cognatilysobacter bugurensis TaxID=543356 RepID=A0A918SYG0_9GAMM|nr:GAF domain-containing protein [Lysobacter bugurensis]GHA78602.1 hypothetical protein GCM10007067_14860 [Lysobacter bugurensis]
MLPPRLPDNELDRLSALRALGLLDTSREPRYDRYVRLVRQLLAVPTAAITLIDSNRQWFKGREGMPLRESSRDVSFCGHAILERGMLCIPDTHADPRFAQNPFVVGPPHIRFYAGCPLRVPGGFAVGTLCAIDAQPRAADREQLMALRDLADCLEREFATQLLMRDVRGHDPAGALPRTSAFKTLESGRPPEPA